MSAVREQFVRMLAQRGHTGLLASEALCHLVIEGGRLGELEVVTVDRRDGSREVKIVPEIWLQRLLDAVRIGVFQRKTPKEVADHVIMTPPGTRLR